MGVEPSGDAFNSIVFDERHRRPHNPMVNAGALATTDLVRGATPEHNMRRILDLMRTCAGDDRLEVDEVTLAAELRTADRNRATAYLMRADGMLEGDVETLLTLYLRQCSVPVTCAQLAVMAATLANGCINPFTGHRALPRNRVSDLRSVMYTCGMYDAAGQWAYDVGVPAKRGVAGGILAVRARQARDSRSLPGAGRLRQQRPRRERVQGDLHAARAARVRDRRRGRHARARRAVAERRASLSNTGSRRVRDGHVGCVRAAARRHRRHATAVASRYVVWTMPRIPRAPRPASTRKRRFGGSNPLVGS